MPKTTANEPSVEVKQKGLEEVGRPRRLSTQSFRRETLMYRHASGRVLHNPRCGLRVNQ